jgi:hypothetical protein
MRARRKPAVPATRLDAAEIAGPAMIGAGHVRDRALSPARGAPKAWRRLSPLEAAFENGQLAGGNESFTAALRFEAGEAYARLFASAAASGRDSTDLDRVGGGDNAQFSEAQVRASHALGEIERRMNARDARIVRMVCGEGYFPSEAVRTVCNDYRHTIAARFREALDSLIEAMEEARRARRQKSP